MKLGKYESLDNKEIKEKFFDYIGSIESPIIDYLAIGVQDTIRKKSTSIMSRPDWQKAFNEMNLAAFDPVRRASFNTQCRIFTFDDINYLDSNGKEVMRQRRRYEIENGIVLIRRNLGYNFMLTLGTGFKNFYPYKYFIDNKYVINKVFDELITLITPSTEKYQLIIRNHPFDDAK